jgi:hypothetical protein
MLRLNPPATNPPAAPDGVVPSELKVRRYPPATNATAAPDGLVPSELKVRRYPPPPTPLQPPTGVSRPVKQARKPAEKTSIKMRLKPFLVLDLSCLGAWYFDTSPGLVRPALQA